MTGHPASCNIRSAHATDMHQNSHAAPASASKSGNHPTPCIYLAHSFRRCLQVDPAGASTSSGQPAPDAIAAAESAEAAGGQQDLQAAFEVAEVARLALERNPEHAGATAEAATEVLELLGEVHAEEERFEDAVKDFGKVRSAFAPLVAILLCTWEDWPWLPSTFGISSCAATEALEPLGRGAHGRRARMGRLRGTETMYAQQSNSHALLQGFSTPALFSYFGCSLHARSSTRAAGAMQLPPGSTMHESNRMCIGALMRAQGVSPSIESWAAFLSTLLACTA